LSSIYLELIRFLAWPRWGYLLRIYSGYYY